MTSAAAGTGKSWQYWSRMVLASVLPSTIAGFVGTLILTFNVLSELIGDPNDESQLYVISRSGMVIYGTFMGATLGQAATIAIGLPAHGYLMRYSRRRAWMYGLAGAGAGLVFGVLLVWPMIFGTSLPPLDDVAWLGVASMAGGAVAGLVFWLIRRPDRDPVGTGHRHTGSPEDMGA